MFTCNSSFATHRTPFRAPPLPPKRSVPWYNVEMYKNIDVCSQRTSTLNPSVQALCCVRVTDRTFSKPPCPPPAQQDPRPRKESFRQYLSRALRSQPQHPRHAPTRSPHSSTSLPTASRTLTTSKQPATTFPTYHRSRLAAPSYAAPALHIPRHAHCHLRAAMGFPHTRRDSVPRSRCRGRGDRSLVCSREDGNVPC
jgi:hypothetical protein